MHYLELFDRACESVLTLPKGRRTFLEMRRYLVDHFVIDTGEEGRLFRQSPLSNDDSILEEMIHSGKDFDIFSPQLDHKVHWDMPSFRKEIFSTWVMEHDTLQKAFCEGGFYVSLFSATADRGLIFLIENMDKKTILKPFQSDLEGEVALKFSESIGPKVYSIGENTLVEDGLISNDYVRYLTLDRLYCKDATKIVAYIFAQMHKNEVVYYLSDWDYEVRVKIQKDKVSPMILDFGWAYRKGTDDPYFDRDKVIWEELVSQDIDTAIRGMKDRYGWKFNKRGFMRSYYNYMCE